MVDGWPDPYGMGLVIGPSSDPGKGAPPDGGGHVGKGAGTKVCASICGSFIFFYGQGVGDGVGVGDINGKIVLYQTP
jgi:hypothetical protein